MKKAIAMRCTQEQFNTVREKVIVPADINKLNKNYEYLVSRRRNDFLGVNFYTEASLKRVCDYEIHEQWNEKAFLEACGIEVIPTLQEVQEYFKDADKIESKYTGLVAINNNEFRYKEFDECYYLDSNKTIEAWHVSRGYAKIISYKKPKYEITEEQIKIIYEKTSISNQEELEEWFPEVFKKELETREWYKRPNNKALFCVLSKPDKTGRFEVYGFDVSGIWMTSEKCYTFSDNEIEATTEEVTEALTKEVVRRGYLKNLCAVKCLCGFSEESTQKYFKNKEPEFYFEYSVNKLWIQGGSFLDICIFDNGIWATIIPTKTKEEAERELNCKIV